MELKDIGKFFRIFDLAFFIPGAALLASLLLLYLPKDQLEKLVGTVPSIELASGLSVAVVTVVATYILGMACHAVGRVLHGWAPEPSPVNPKHVPWYQHLPDPNILDHTLYLWVLASTSLNLAAACLIVGVLDLTLPPGQTDWKWVGISTFGFFAFLYGFVDFRDGYRGFAARIKPTASTPSEQPSTS